MPKHPFLYVMKTADLIFDFLHFIIHFNQLVSRTGKFLADFFISGHLLDSFFVPKLMFQSCPEIHGICADLDFCTHGDFSLGEKDGNLHNHVVTAVTVGLWVFDIVFDLNDGDIILAGEKVGDGVDIVDKGTDYTDSGHIIQVCSDIFISEIIS